MPPNNGYEKLPSYGHIEKIIEYGIPSDIYVTDAARNYDYYMYTLNTGHYYLKIEYRLYRLDTLGQLEEIIGGAVSNQIELCIK